MEDINIGDIYCYSDKKYLLLSHIKQKGDQQG